MISLSDSAEVHAAFVALARRIFDEAYEAEDSDEYRAFLDLIGRIQAKAAGENLRKIFDQAEEVVIVNPKTGVEQRRVGFEGVDVLVTKDGDTLVLRSRGENRGKDLL